MSTGPVAHVLKSLSKLDDLYNGLPKYLDGLLCTYLHPLLGAYMLVGSHGSLSLSFLIKVMVSLCCEQLS
jgi:hypothetical protein